jgi:hypothetical protein
VTAEPQDCPNDIKQFSFVGHLAAGCDMQTSSEHTGAIRIRCTEGASGLTEDSVDIYYDTRIFEDTTFRESQRGGTEDQTNAFDYRFTADEEVFETPWVMGPTEFTTGINMPVLYKAGVWQTQRDAWTTVSSVGL